MTTTMTTTAQTGAEPGGLDAAKAGGDGPVVAPELIDALMSRVDRDGLALVGPGGVLSEVTRLVLERAIAEELTDDLGYEKGDRAGRGSGNSRNGSYAKTVLTDIGAVDIQVPRDRNGTFTPKILPKGESRLKGFNDQIIALYAGGMTTRDIRRHLGRIYGVEVSPEMISRVTDGVVEELTEWQNRPLDPLYPIVYIDALVVKVRDQGVVRNKAAYVAIGVDLAGRKHIFGIWIGDGDEGAKFWLTVLTEVRNRGVADVLFVCCDGLKGLPDAIEATWPKAIVQTCVVHLIRNSTRFCSYKDRKAVLAGLRPVYTAISVEAAAGALDDFELTWGDRYPAVVKLWRDAWERFTPFLAYPAALRKVVYTTNLIESVNYQLRKVSKNRGHYPHDDAALKLLRLAARDITTTRGGDAGTGTQGWQQVLNVLAIHFPDRVKFI